MTVSCHPIPSPVADTCRQSELENATEKLSNMLETEDVIKWCDPEDRVEMINQTNQVETRVKHLLDALDVRPLHTSHPLLPSLLLLLSSSSSSSSPHLRSLSFFLLPPSRVFDCFLPQTWKTNFSESDRQDMVEGEKAQ